MSLFVNMTWFWTDKWEGIIPEAITEKTGVSFDVTRAADGQQLGLMIASGDLSDMVLDGDNVSRLSSADVCFSYQDLIQKYCPDWVVDPVYVQNAVSKSNDGKYYAFFNELNTNEACPIMT